MSSSRYTIRKLKDGRYQATFRAYPGGKRVTKTSTIRRVVQQWADAQSVSVGTTGDIIHPRNARMTVGEWCDVWLAGYARKESTVRQARVHIAKIKAGLGDQPMSTLRPSQISAWVKGLLDEGLKDSYVAAVHARLSQVLNAAADDRILVTPSPTSRKTSPKVATKQRPYVATHEQVRALSEVFPRHQRPALWLAAFAGLRDGEMVGLPRT